MPEEQIEPRRSKLWRSLQLLSRDRGVWRPDLLELLQGELSELRFRWTIDPDRGLDAARSTIAANIHAYTAQLIPRISNLSLRPEQRAEQYRTVIFAYFNAVPGRPDLRGMNLTQRREWLAQEERGTLRISIRTSQRDFDHAITQIEQLLSQGKYLSDTLHQTFEEPISQLEQSVPSPAFMPSGIATVGGPFIDRDDYILQVQSLVSSGHKVIWLWGEAGTGKTVLAHQAAKAITDRQVLTLRPGNRELLRDDIVNALLFEGLDPAAWAEAYARTALRRLLAGRPRCGAVVIDDSRDVETLWQLVPQAPTVPVIVTSRERLSGPGIAALELHDFTEDQASGFVNEVLVDCEAAVLDSFIRVLGFRPLALGHAVLYVRETGLSLRELTNTLAAGVATGVRLVTPPSWQTQSLTRLYQEMLVQVTADEQSAVVLDGFLSVTGMGGVFNLELLREFLGSEQGGGLDRVRFHSGLRILTFFGLIREGSHTQGTYLTMHPFTYEVLRELRGPGLQGIADAYVSFLFEFNLRDDEELNSGRRWMRVLKQELLDSADLIDGWKFLLCVDERTYVARREYTDESGEEQTYLVRYESLPHGLYKIDFISGRRVPLEFDEARQLYRAATVDGERMFLKYLPGHLTEQERALELSDHRMRRYLEALSNFDDSVIAKALADKPDDHVARYLYFMFRNSMPELSRIRSLIPPERRRVLVQIVQTWAGKPGTA